MPETIELYSPILPYPGSMTIVGATFSGKTTLLTKIIKYKKELFSKVPKTVVYCYGEHPGDLLREFDDVVYHKGLPSQETLDDWIALYENDGWILCFDDLSTEFYSNKSSENLISRVVHHSRLYLIIIGHNLFSNGKHARFASLNYHSFLLTRSCRDLNQFAILGRQLFGVGKGQKFVQCYIDATELRPNQRPGYLFVNTHPIYSSREGMLFTNIFPDEYPQILYKLQ